jgi:hypothetical protein
MGDAKVPDGAQLQFRIDGDTSTNWKKRPPGNAIGRKPD